ncbi:hypothetical protein WR25_22551 [Diploscapter pachys]|uniref:Activin types I and II receptor domain-containing protein n=1 Tax=Diploscapter pachys TaxID=2018661 RepID=A0A2A2JY12_9BILA|nr:hypothetical protein WR25_22551 [Diploscapter pachys]
MKITNIQIFLSMVTLPMIVSAITCYDGSKAPIKGNTTTNFIRMECDEGMQYCFESYNANFSIVTASCQNLNTESKMLDVCKMPGMCDTRDTLDITICCCNTDLCNLQSFLVPTGPTKLRTRDRN